LNATEISGLLDSLAVRADSGKLNSAPDCLIRYQRWIARETVGVVLLIQGRGGFLEKYYPTVIQLLQRRLSVISFEWRGQGLSRHLVAGSDAGHVDDFGDYVDDLDLVVSQLFNSDDSSSIPGPRFLLAHSMGAHVLLRWLAEHHPDGAGFQQAWLTATLMGPNTSPYPTWVARFLSWLFCRGGQQQRYVFGGGPFDAVQFESDALSDLNSNSEQIDYELRCLQDNPSLQLGSATFGWLRQLFRSIDQLQQPGLLEKIQLPVTQFMAGDEQVVDNRAVEQLQQRLQRGALLQIPKSKHDILLESPSINEPLWAEIDRVLSLN